MDWLSQNKKFRVVLHYHSVYVMEYAKVYDLVYAMDLAYDLVYAKVSVMEYDSVYGKAYYFPQPHYHLGYEKVYDWVSTRAYVKVYAMECARVCDWGFLKVYDLVYVMEYETGYETEY